MVNRQPLMRSMMSLADRLPYSFSIQNPLSAGCVPTVTPHATARTSSVSHAGHARALCSTAARTPSGSTRSPNPSATRTRAATMKATATGAERQPLHLHLEVLADAGRLDHFLESRPPRRRERPCPRRRSARRSSAWRASHATSRTANRSSSTPARSARNSATVGLPRNCSQSSGLWLSQRSRPGNSSGFEEHVRPSTPAAVPVSCKRSRRSQPRSGPAAPERS